MPLHKELFSAVTKTAKLNKVKQVEAVIEAVFAPAIAIAHKKNLAQRLGTIL